jgi:site-specific recombinase XerD
MNFETAADQFYRYSLHIRGFSPNTIRRYKYSIDQYKKFAGITEICQVTPANVRALFFHGRTERKWSVSTFVVVHKSLLVFFRWCMTQGYLTENPILDIEIPKAEKRLPVKLSKHDAFHLLEAVYNYPHESDFLRCRNHAIFATFIFAGLRLSELLHLRYTDVDLSSRTLFISQGKGSKDRFIPINETLARSLERYLVERKKENKTCPQFFASHFSNVGVTSFGMRHIVHRVRKASGISFTIHKLRHTFATLMLEGGCDIYSLSQMLGHSDIKTTTLYLYASAHHLQQQIAKHPLGQVVGSW